MATTTNYFEQSQLSLAAYALNLQQGMFGGTDQNSPYVKALTDAGMSATQAVTFASTYTVVDQYTDPLSGLSATVFDKGGIKYLAVRGTEPNTLGVVMDVIADIGIFQGLNGQQQHQQLKSYCQSLLLSGTIQAGSFSVTGHSLGGLLAQMLAVDYAGQIAQTTTFNAPGVGGIGAQILQSVGLLPNNVPLTGVTNVYAQPGLSATAGLGTLLGDTQAVYIEANLDPLHNHSMATLTDSLALYNLFATLDPSLNAAPNGIQTITDILKASSNVAANSLESAVSVLGKLFGVPGAVVTGNAFDTNRDLLYTALGGIRAALPASGLSLVAADSNILNSAKATTPDAIAYRYALVNANPFAVLGADYSAHNGNGELDFYNAATRCGDLTDQYLTDRSGYLTAKLRDNTVDSANSTIKDVRYSDLATSTTLNPINTEQRKVTFGGAADEGFSGGNGNDGLYGGGGNLSAAPARGTPVGAPPLCGDPIAGSGQAININLGSIARCKREAANDAVFRAIRTG